MKTPAAPHLLVTLVLAAFLSGCSDDPSGPPINEEPPPRECTSALTAGDDGAFVELCALEAPVRHVRIENLRAPATHASAQIVFGFTAPPTSPTATLGADQFRVLLYGGGNPAPAPMVQASFGATDEALDGDAAFINAGATICFDVHDGSAGTAPHFVLWVDGQRGANCANRATLTAATAFGARANWSGATGAIAKQAKAYFRQTAGAGTTPKITMFADPVLDASAIAAATTCTTAWTANTDWQQLCAPAAGGAARHVRIEGVQSAANNSYFYAVFGQDAGPTGNPAQSAGKLIITGGRSSSGASWTWFRFNTGTTTQFNYATDAPAALYTEAPATICFDTGANANGTARLVFWATGAKGADCAVRSSLTLDRALYDSATDPTTASIWDVPYVAGKFNFLKTNNGNVTLGNVVVSAEPAAL